MRADGWRRRGGQSRLEDVGREPPPATDLDGSRESTLACHPRNRSLVKAESCRNLLRAEQVGAVPVGRLKVWAKPRRERGERVLVQRRE